MRAETRAVVDEFWATLFGLTVDELHSPGTRAIEHVGLGDYQAVYILMLGRSVIVSSPADPAPELTRVLGPSIHTYLDAMPNHPTEGVREAQYEQVAGLRNACGEAAWMESGFAERAERCFVIEEAGRIVAASNLTPWRNEPTDVGVLVDPAFTGRGLGTKVAARAAAVAVETAGICRYRALESNVPSLRIATNLGFTPYGRNLVLKSA
jgi:RimJ/RimL family protein N-acetyltransferase